ncbi:hypothetical protein TH63_13690 [Rufibacter radiotolerans]|uniref:Acetyl xylan esterase domain-containing protein n=1 Tax=Rufibacter radiotolerans TaxID=1379910 RepID=A0A0H4W7L3_9BACT|nr:acetylxylan esterase [Rufibacter radiotolerans]AKQ46436.1 hypothetical protein TH63_13690 [Rufibacter radiotolerans]
MRNPFLFLVFCLHLLYSKSASAQNAPAPLKLVNLVLTPNSDDWTYAVNQPASVQIMVLKNDVPLKDVTISYEFGPEMRPPEKKGTMLLKEGQVKLDIGTSQEPGFRQLLVKAEHHGKTYNGQVKVGFSPEKILPTVTMPKDFLAFWNKAKTEAAKVPMDAQVTLLPEHSTAKVDVYLVNLQNYRKGQRLYGYLCKPKAPGKYPVLFTPPGAGVKATAPYTGFADQGFISFSIEIHGYSPMLNDKVYDSLKKVLANYNTQNLEHRDAYYYKKVYLGCVRSIDYLVSLPEYDGKNVVVTGGSQGGALAIVTAALDKRVKALACFYPALSDMTGYLQGRAGGWPHLFTNGSASDANAQAKINTIGYYDVVNFAKQVTVPGFYSWGYNDNTCPPTSVYAVVNSVKAPKTISLSPIAAHWRFEDTNQESIQWLKQQVTK